MAEATINSHAPRVTLITVCWNAERTIADTLKSIDGQTYRDFEHIIIDGGSTDETLSIIAEANSVNRHVFSGPDAGIYYAMNKGIDIAKGDIIGFLNADDIFEDKDSLAAVASALEDEAYDACYGDLIYVSNRNPSRRMRHWKSGPFKPGLFQRGWCPPHPTFYVRRRIYNKLGKFDLRYRLGADVELMLRFLEIGRINAIYIPRVLVRMRLGGATNKSARNISRQNSEILRAFHEHGFKISVPKFWVSKIVNRVGQFLTRNRKPEPPSQVL
ncbi:glycosyltransferase family 2 protein [Rhizobium sp. WYJ-E13]|uniref:glycosyltransferase family 2 protein n=1 Tax=Rhizobium sp. WYJ-E13 TaxID=2849093 RepID=UPI001C1EEBF4|nr:glycosyltransferase family 2 protein [Rhizobium sp. WYJ-E13]QWW72233.1 glycosyltransferase [Rhizobium sp. WYJ-E13]